MKFLDRNGPTRILEEVLTRFVARREGREVQPQWHSVESWWEGYRPACRAWAPAIDQAIAGGALADRVGYAFAAGYQAALRRMIPDAPEDRIVCLSVTEDGGGHPRAIQSSLTRARDGSWRLNGRKRWATLSAHGGTVFVAASTGQDEAGRNQLRIARVALDTAGVAVEPMPPTQFVPEIPHGQLKFEDVRVDEDSLLPGDGYVDYVKPFRTLEDIFVGAAILTYVVGVAIRYEWPREAATEMLHLVAALRSLGEADPRSAAIHLALEGLLEARQRLMTQVDDLWELVDVDERLRWKRDRPLTQVAQKVRALRAATAWQRGIVERTPAA